MSKSRVKCQPLWRRFHQLVGTAVTVQVLKQKFADCNVRKTCPGSKLLSLSCLFIERRQNGAALNLARIFTVRTVSPGQDICIAVDCTTADRVKVIALE